MKTTTKNNSDKTATGRPSLYSFNSRGRDSGEISSILDALEPRHRKSAIWWRAGLIGLVLLLAAALYVVGRHVDVYRNLSPAATDEMLIGRTVVKQEVREPIPAAASAPVEQPSAATIVVEAPMHHAELQASEVKAQNKVQEQAVAEVDSVNAVDAEDAKTGSSTDAKPKSTLSNTASEKHLAAGIAAVPVRKKESRPVSPAQANAKASSKEAIGKDSDVDLIAALVSHVSRGDTSGKEARKKNVRPTADSRPVGGPVRKDKRPDTNRDIVVRNEGDSTEALVKRCRTLGLIEGELCRVRICSGLWGADPACPGAAAGDQQLTSGR